MIEDRELGTKVIINGVEIVKVERGWEIVVKSTLSASKYMRIAPTNFG